MLEAVGDICHSSHQRQLRDNSALLYWKTEQAHIPLRDSGNGFWFLFELLTGALKQNISTWPLELPHTTDPEFQMQAFQGKEQRVCFSLGSSLKSHTTSFWQDVTLSVIVKANPVSWNGQGYVVQKSQGSSPVFNTKVLWNLLWGTKNLTWSHFQGTVPIFPQVNTKFLYTDHLPTSSRLMVQRLSLQILKSLEHGPLWFPPH